MKIAHLTPGSGDSFYCENCLRDAVVVRALRALGHDVTMIPMYLPLQADRGEKVSNAPIFFGGINVYLQQKTRFFQKTPRWLDKLFDSPRLLNWLSHRTDMVDAAELGETTLSMLKGEDGRQAKELRRLVEWLSREENRPDIICLSNLLLTGLAKQLKTAVKAPIVCLLQDEDVFLDDLIEEYRQPAWELLRRTADSVDLFLCVSRYFADYMESKVGISKDAVQVVYTGIEVDRYICQEKPPAVGTIGYLSRMCESKGLGALIEAFRIAKSKAGGSNFKLKISGGHTAEDEPFLKQVKSKIHRAGLEKDVEWVHGLHETERLDFLRSLSLTCVPETRPPAYGLYALESLAVGVPVVEPSIGVFKELNEITVDAFILYEPNTASALAEKLCTVLADLERLRKLGKSGRNAILEKFDIRKTCREVACTFDKIIKNYNG